MVNNQGIMHLADKPGGRPWCNRRNAHMSTTPDKLGNWSRICVRCDAERMRRTERAAKKAASQDDLKDMLKNWSLRELAEAGIV